MSRVKPASSRVKPATSKVRPPIAKVRAAVSMVLPPLTPSSGRFGSRYTQVISLVPYYGGKNNLCALINRYIGEAARGRGCTTYVEAFGGGGRSLINLNLTKHDFDKAVYNEYSKTMCNLMTVVKDHELVEKMIDCLHGLQCDKETFDYIKATQAKGNHSLLDTAVMEYILHKCSFIGDGLSYGTENAAKLKNYRNNAARLRMVHKRLNRFDVEIINGDYRRMIELYGQREDVVLYLDPPYHVCARYSGALKVYPGELTAEQHQEFVRLLCQCKCSWVVSGYDPLQWGCEDYIPLETAGAEKVSLGIVTVSASDDKIKKEEFLWVKY